MYICTAVYLGTYYLGSALDLALSNNLIHRTTRGFCTADDTTVRKDNMYTPGNTHTDPLVVQAQQQWHATTHPLDEVWAPSCRPSSPLDSSERAGSKTKETAGRHTRGSRWESTLGLMLSRCVAKSQKTGGPWPQITYVSPRNKARSPDCFFRFSLSGPCCAPAGNLETKRTP